MFLGHSCMYDSFEQRWRCHGKTPDLHFRARIGVTCTPTLLDCANSKQPATILSNPTTRFFSGCCRGPKGSEPLNQHPGRCARKLLVELGEQGTRRPTLTSRCVKLAVAMCSRTARRCLQTVFHRSRIPDEHNVGPTAAQEGGEIGQRKASVPQDRPQR